MFYDCNGGDGVAVLTECPSGHVYSRKAALCVETGNQIMNYYQLGMVNFSRLWMNMAKVFD